MGPGPMIRHLSGNPHKYESKLFRSRPKIVAHSVRLWKIKIAIAFSSWRPCFSIEPISSALHLQGLESNMYVHFHWVNNDTADAKRSPTNCQEGGVVEWGRGPWSGTFWATPQNKSRIFKFRLKIVAHYAQLREIKLPLHSWRPHFSL